MTAKQTHNCLIINTPPCTTNENEKNTHTDFQAIKENYHLKYITDCKVTTQPTYISNMYRS